MGLNNPDTGEVTRVIRWLGHGAAKVGVAAVFIGMVISPFTGGLLDPAPAFKFLGRYVLTAGAALILLSRGIQYASTYEITRPDGTGDTLRAPEAVERAEDTHQR